MDYRDLASERRDLRRDRQHRHGRARRLGQHRRLRAAPWPGCSSRAGACSTTASPACATPTPRRAPSPSATSSPTPRRCTSRATCWRSNGPASSTHHVEDFAPDYAETLRHWASNLDDNLEEAIRLAGPERVRVWRLYLRAARNGFDQRLHQHLPGALREGLTRGRSRIGEAARLGSRRYVDRPVGAGLALFLDRVAAGGDADDPDAGAVAGGDVARGVADGDRRAGSSGAAADRRRRARSPSWSARCGRASRSRSRRRRRSG